MTLYEYVVYLLAGVDLEKFDFIVPMIISFIIVLSIGVTFRSLLTIFNQFFIRR